MSARGEQRRAALVSAAAELLGSGGPGALTARAVAAQAAVPLAAVTYYFESVDDLVRAAADLLYTGYRAAAESLIAATAVVDDRACAELLVRVWLDPTDGGPHPRRVRGLLLSCAAAGDSPALAPQLRRYDEDLQGLIRRVLAGQGRDGRKARVLLAAVDGFALARLSGVWLPAPVPADPRALTPEQLLSGLTSDVLCVLDQLAPAQKSRAVGSSRPDSAT